jgi:acyl carrier protein
MTIATSETVQRILADILSLPVEGVTMESSPEDLNRWDSLQHLNFVLAVEQEFDVVFKPEEIEKITSVKAMVDLLGVKIPQSVK